MTQDPLRFILWHLLLCEEVIDPEEVYAFDALRVRAVLIEAGMRERGDGLWQTSPATARWYERTWHDLRLAVPSVAEGTLGSIDAAEAALPPEALSAPVASQVSAPTGLQRANRKAHRLIDSKA